MSEIEIDRDGKDWSKQAQEVFAEFEARALLANVSVVCVVAVDLDQENSIRVHFSKVCSDNLSAEMCQDIARMFELMATKLRGNSEHRRTH